MRMTESSFLDLDKDCRVHCLRFGRGSELMIALHGFGDSGRFFLPLAQSLGARYTVYAVDLPYHGLTAWPASGYHSKDIEAIVGVILAREGKQTFSWLGFSFGGRIILSTLGRFAGRLNAVFLIAPDGLGTRGMALPSIIPAPLRRIWAGGLQDPGWLLRLAGHLHRRRLIDSFTLRFLRHHLGADERRRCLLRTWMSLDHFTVRPQQVRRRLRAHEFPTVIILGRNDRLISIPAVQRLASHLSQVNVVILDGDHFNMVRKEVGELVAGDW